jgi:hypothetical protein
LSNIGNKSPSNNSNNNSVAVKIVPFGPSIKNINSLTSKLINRPKVRTYLKSISQDEGGERLQQNKTMTANKQTPRLLSFELLPETATTNAASNRVAMPKSYLSKYYDYENNYCITIKGKLG